MQFSPIWEIATGKSVQKFKNVKESELRTGSGTYTGECENRRGNLCNNGTCGDDWNGKATRGRQMPNEQKAKEAKKAKL